MLCPLKQAHTFEQLAKALDPLGLDLVNVRACTFPSRPEPQSAAWKANTHTIMRYHYEPDLELRALELQMPWPDDLALTPSEVREDLGLFESWDTLAHDLVGAQRGRMIRASAAWRWRAMCHPNSLQRHEALEHLIRALDQQEDVQRQRQVCLELRRCATQRAQSALERASKHVDLEVRLHAREALQALHEREFLLRRR